MAVNYHTPNLSLLLTEQAQGCALSSTGQHLGIQGTQNTPWGHNLTSLIMMYKALSYC